jgi:mono/diheme cytochrome c family protein
VQAIYQWRRGDSTNLRKRGEEGKMIERTGLALVALSMTTVAALAQPRAECSQGRNAEIRVQVCTQVIEGSGFSVDDKAILGSLTPAKLNSGWKPSILPIAEAEQIGVPRKGLSYAHKVCAQCHAVSLRQAVSPDANAPTFKDVADTPGMSPTALAVFLRTPHPTMPNLVIEPEAMDDLIAYILTLKSKN